MYDFLVIMYLLFMYYYYYCYYVFIYIYCLCSIISRIVCIINLLMVSKKILLAMAYIWIMCGWVCVCVMLCVRILVKESICNKKICF